MPTIFIYNNDTDRMERYYRGLLEPMPYISGGALTVDEFRGSSRSNILWTDKRTMESWNAFRRGWGKPIFVGYAFKRIWEGGHAAMSQHYAGMALDTGQNLSSAERNDLRNYAINSGLWSYVEPASLTPTWVHVDKRLGTPACPRGGYPSLSNGSKGVYVLVLQDALSALGFNYAGFDGVFGPMTMRALMDFQIQQGLPVTGVADCATWARLAGSAKGIGATGTVVRY